MAFWNDSRGVGEFVRAGDRTLNVLVLILLAAFALGSASYYYGQMNPRGPALTSQSAPGQPTTPEVR
jgi:hypothetical protein